MRALALTCALSFAFSSHARAADRPAMAVSYTLGEDTKECPSYAELRRSLTEEAGYDPIVPATEQTRSVLIELSRDKSGQYVADVRDAGALRTFRAKTCNAVVSSVVLALVVSLDDAPKPAPVPPPPAPPTTVSVLLPIVIERAVPVAPPPASKKRRLQGHADVGFGVGNGFVPEVSTGPQLEVGLRGHLFDVSLSATYQVVMQANSTLPQLSGVSGASMQSVLVGPTVCLAPDVSSWLSILACGAGLFGASFVEGEQLEVSRSSTSFAAFLGPRFGIEVLPLTPLSIRASAELMGNLHRTNIFLEGNGFPEFVYRAPPVASRVVVTLGSYFP